MARKCLSLGKELLLRMPSSAVSAEDWDSETASAEDRESVQESVDEEEAQSWSSSKGSSSMDATSSRSQPSPFCCPGAGGASKPGR